MTETKTAQKLREALGILNELGLPKAQQNQRSALTLLALLNLKPENSWVKATSPLCGITPMMEFFTTHYDVKYAPNSRETVRRSTIHQFLDAGLILSNPDAPTRPINSGKTVYHIAPSVLTLLKSFDTPQWKKNLAAYLASSETLTKKYAQDRKMVRIPVTITQGQTILLSPGGQNVLVAEIIKEFASRFTPGAQVLYVGDTDEKFSYCNQERLSAIGLKLNTHGKMPDVVIEYVSKKWLVLIEAVTSHGPINPKRHRELRLLFATSELPLVFVTAFLTRAAMVKYLAEISWETEVWVAESPSHLIHFNGERFLGPYSD
jgi:hypothetical protein